ncbi:MAG TPA: enoyl-CoA hydratase-related protein [Dehalococcoidia bacterium]|nr:enoyl-CoA hydratase-related protein [Dehalococcoidia bacterium]
MTTATDTTYEQILFEQRNRVGVITLNRPEKLNAWTWKMAAEITDAISRCNEDSGIGAIVITGAGRGFCAGADISGFNQAIEARESGEQEERPRRRAEVGFYQQSKPIIVAINGVAVGVGLTMTLPMDIRIASDKARFSMRFVRMGITPEAQSSVYLPQIVGIANALELSLTARIIDAETALRYGLVSRVVPHDDLMKEALALADEIASNPTDAATAAKQILHRNMVEQDLESVVRGEGEVIVKQYESAGHKEAIRAFIEKREPNFNQ